MATLAKVGETATATGSQVGGLGEATDRVNQVEGMMARAEKVEDYVAVERKVGGCWAGE